MWRVSFYGCLWHYCRCYKSRCAFDSDRSVPLRSTGFVNYSYLLEGQLSKKKWCGLNGACMRCNNHTHGKKERKKIHYGYGWPYTAPHEQ
jgi:hypothetical protein